MNELLEACCAFFRERRLEAYLVGGTVRDLLLGRAQVDLDFVVSGDALQVSRALADALGGAFYSLDPVRETGRVVMPDRTLIDVALMRGATLADDLAVRDFTINAMAMPSSDLGRLIDPFHGTRDLQARLVRAVTEQSFVIDPVRMLRALRQSQELDFRIEDETVTLMQRDRELLSRVSGERARDELARMLVGGRGAHFLELLVEFDHLRLLLPHANWSEEAGTAARGIDRHSDPHGLSDASRGMAPEYAALLADYASQQMADARTRLVGLRLSILYADAGQVEADLRHLKFSRHEVEFVRALVRHREMFHALPPPVTPLAAHRFFRDSSGVGLGLIYLALATAEAKPGEEPVVQRASRLLDFYTQRADVISPQPVMNGADIAARFRLRGPQIGDALRALVEAQVSGAVRSREQAEQFLRELTGVPS